MIDKERLTSNVEDPIVKKKWQQLVREMHLHSQIMS